jgi:hypothetical protein
MEKSRHGLRQVATAPHKKKITVKSESRLPQVSPWPREIAQHGHAVANDNHPIRNPSQSQLISDLVHHHPHRRQTLAALRRPAHARERGFGAVFVVVLDGGSLVRVTSVSKMSLISGSQLVVERLLTFAQAPSPLSMTSVIAQPFGSALPLSTFSMTMAGVKVVATLKILKLLWMYKHWLDRVPGE